LPLLEDLVLCATKYSTLYSSNEEGQTYFNCGWNMKYTPAASCHNDRLLLFQKDRVMRDTKYI
jgi:hypothetical protein